MVEFFNLSFQVGESLLFYFVEKISLPEEIIVIVKGVKRRALAIQDQMVALMGSFHFRFVKERQPTQDICLDFGNFIIELSGFQIDGFKFLGSSHIVF